MFPTVVIVSLLFLAFFTGVETAYASSNKIYLEIRKKRTGFLAVIITRLTLDPSRFLATMLVGKALALVVFVGYSYRFFTALYGFQLAHILLAVALVFLILVVVNEIVIKNFSRIYANEIIRYLALPAYVMYWFLGYFSAFVIWFSDAILKGFFNTRLNTGQTLFSKLDLEKYVTEQVSAIENEEEMDSEIQIFQNALEFSSLKARDIMTPRTELIAVEIHNSVAVLREKFIETGYSKIIVYQNTFDTILGYVHSFDLFKKPRTIKAVMIPVEFVPETILIKEVLSLLTKRRKSMAVVLDEYGGTSGIITVEDIVEELFGEIEDEHDEDEELTETQLSSHSYLLSTRFDVAYLNEKYAFKIPESDSYSTLGGYIVNSLKEIPREGDTFVIDSFTFSVEKATFTKIELVKMTIAL